MSETTVPQLSKNFKSLVGADRLWVPVWLYPGNAHQAEIRITPPQFEAAAIFAERTAQAPDEQKALAEIFDRADQRVHARKLAEKGVLGRRDGKYTMRADVRAHVVYHREREG